MFFFLVRIVMTVNQLNRRDKTFQSQTGIFMAIEKLSMLKPILW